MKLNTGKKAFPIEFDNGDKDVIYFNPNDPDLATRLISAKDNISARMNNLEFEDFDLDLTGEPVTVADVDELMHLDDEKYAKLEKEAVAVKQAFEKTKEILFEELDGAFNSNVSAVVFKHCSPFAVVNGEYFVMQFLSAILPEIQKAVDKSNKDLEKKMSKHIAKYKK